MSKHNFEMCGRDLEDTALPDERLVSHLKFLVAKAECGELHGIAYTGVCLGRNGTIIATATGYIGEGVDGHVQNAMGGLDVVKHRILHDRMAPWNNLPLED